MRVQSFHPALVERLNTSDLARKIRREYPKLSGATFGRVAARHRRRENPVMAGVVDIITQPYFDSFTIAANTAFTKQVMFQTPIGQGGKTLNLTNMTQAGFLPNPQRLTVKGLRLYLSNNAVLADVQNFLLNNSFVLTVGKKPMLEVPCLAVTAGLGGIYTSGPYEIGTAAAGDVSAFSSSNGIPDARSFFVLDDPIQIEQGESFNVTINPEVAWSTQNAGRPVGTGITAYVFLDGELIRGVQ